MREANGAKYFKWVLGGALLVAVEQAMGSVPVNTINIVPIRT